MARSSWKFFFACGLTAAVILFFSLTTRFSLSMHTDLYSESVDASYGLVIDAGSTGSRLFLYRWTSRSDQELIKIEPVVDEFDHPVVMKVSPGLSSFIDSPENATEYLQPLFAYAVQFIPEAQQPYTSVFIMATAGMRLLPIEKSSAILKNLHDKLQSVTPLQIIPDHIRVIEGQWEGIYSWIAVNYILGRFEFDIRDKLRQPTVGIVDMGGASVQIAVELNQYADTQVRTVEHINLGCRDDEETFKYQLFVTTFLGYGVNEGLRRYEQILSDKASIDNTSYVRDFCLPVNLIKRVNRSDGSQFIRKGIGDWDRCVQYLSDVVSNPNGNKDCVVQNCLLGQVPAPLVSLSQVELYGFSEYWFSTDHVLSLGGIYNFSNFAEGSRNYCRQKWASIQSLYRRNLYPKANENRLRSQCFKSSWITAILHAGFSINKTFNRFRSVFDVNGQEVQWTLGALLYHMRYFPLRDVQRQHLLDKRRRHSARWKYAYFLLVFAAMSICYVVFFRWKRSTGFLRREPSMWRYMMVSQDQICNSEYKLVGFS